MVDCPRLVLPQAKDTIEDLCESVQSEYLKASIRDFRDKLDESIVDTDPREVIDMMRNEVLTLAKELVTESDEDFGAGFQDGLAEHIHAMSSADGLLGIPWPWEEMNEATQGICPGDLILWYGIPKSMKTWIGLYVCTWLFLKGYKVLVYSREMTYRIMRLRCGSILASVDYTRLKRNQLTPLEWARIDKAIQLLEHPECGHMMFTRNSNPDGSAAGVQALRMKVDAYEPDFIMLDSAYLMSNDRTGESSMKWNDLSAISQDVKQMILASNIPTMLVWQESERLSMKYGKAGRGTASLALATQLVYDADLAVKIVYNHGLSKASLHLAAARETEFDGLTINACAGYDFTFSSLDLLHNGEEESVGGGLPETKPSSQQMAELQNMFRNSVALQGRGAAEPVEEVEEDEPEE